MFIAKVLFQCFLISQLFNLEESTCEIFNLESYYGELVCPLPTSEADYYFEVNESKKIGVVGPAGVRGTSGRVGPPGLDGIQGLRGKFGHQGSKGHNGVKGYRGPKGAKGIRGNVGKPGPAGVVGPIGEPGRGKLSQSQIKTLGSKAFANVTDAVKDMLYCLETNEMNFTLIVTEMKKELDILYKALEKSKLKRLQNVTSYQETIIPDPKKSQEEVIVNPIGSSWKRIVYVDMSNQSSHCPLNFAETHDKDANMRACGPTVDVGCTSAIFRTPVSYDGVRGVVRGYQYRSTAAFHRRLKTSIDYAYLDGVSISSGLPRTHIWSYAVGHHQGAKDVGCPCDTNSSQEIPDYVNDNYYCDTGFLKHPNLQIAWDKPLWNGEGCESKKTTCCNRHGWFYREIPKTQNFLEVRTCTSNLRHLASIFFDLMEIWIHQA